jgi:hypothetical protein
MYSNTTTTGSAYYFDDVMVTGNKALDTIPPKWTQFEMLSSNKLKLTFSEAIDFSKATFQLDNKIGMPVSKLISSNQLSIELIFPIDFLKGNIYNLETRGIIDLFGNELVVTQKSIAIAETIALGDVVLNEILFDSPINSAEYVEIYNCSDKNLDLSTLSLTTRKVDGTLNTGITFPNQTKILPKSYLVLTSDAEKIQNYYALNSVENIFTSPWTSLNNDGNTLVLTNQNQDTIYDEVKYSVKWHHPLVKNPKGVALERINSSLPSQDASSWHSASSEFNFGTPAYQNSQFHLTNTTQNQEKFLWLEQDSFSPDNDGINDICFIHF